MREEKAIAPDRSSPVRACNQTVSRAWPAWRLHIGLFHSAASITEWRNSLFPHFYLQECRKYCPELTRADLIPEPAGIRAQAVTSTGELIHDFLFLQTERMLHVCNAPSPAATSAIPIARMIVERTLSRAAA